MNRNQFFMLLLGTITFGLLKRHRKHFHQYPCNSKIYDDIEGT